MKRRSWILGGALAAGATAGAQLYRRSRRTLSVASQTTLSRKSGPFAVLPGFECHVPDDPQKPFVGRLEALTVVGRPGLHTEASLPLRAAVEVDWVPIEDPEARLSAPHEQARERGAARFARGEGIWLDGEGVVFTATTGGKAGGGQLFRIDFSKQTLTLVAEARTEDDFNGPDDLTVAPWGDFVIAEDGPPPNHLYLVRPDGSMLPLLRNVQSASELAGVCFSPDGQTSFGIFSTMVSPSRFAVLGKAFTTASPESSLDLKASRDTRVGRKMGARSRPRASLHGGSPEAPCCREHLHSALVG